MCLYNRLDWWEKRFGHDLAVYGRVVIPAYDRPNGLEGDGRWRCPVCVAPRFGVESRDSGVPTRRDGTSQGWGFKGSLSLCTATIGNPGTKTVTGDGGCFGNPNLPTLSAIPCQVR